MGNTLLIKGGYIVDPDTRFEGRGDLLIADGVIRDVGADLPVEADRVIDASALTVFPGLVDLHVHLRDPGQTYKEDITTASMAAARGGVTSMLAMPNTNPPMDAVQRIEYVTGKARTDACVRIYQAASITKEMAGETLTDIEAIIGSGCKAFSEDGKSVMSAALMYDAMKRIAAMDGLICDHCEDITMVRGGVMNEDASAVRLGLPGIPNAVEDVIAARDALLAASTGARLHLCHCSTKGSVAIVSDAKRDGVKITAEVCPHHFILTSDDIPCDDANYKMNPPLRTKQDVEALRRGLRDGTIDCISTDHAPHAAEEKSKGFLRAPFGIVGLETSAALTYTELVKPGILTLMQMAEKMSGNPARILRVPGGSLRVGAPADLALFDFNAEWKIDPAAFASKGKNTPFAGRSVFGKTMYTIVGGRIAWERRKK